MSYFHKNLKTLRERYNLSQADFAKLFGLSVSNVKSYENASYPKLDVLLRIMEHFSIDLKKFHDTDMEKHSVFVGEGNVAEENRSKELDIFFNTGLINEERFAFLEAVDLKEIKKRYVKLYLSKELLLKDWTELLDKYNRLLEKKVKK